MYCVSYNNNKQSNNVELFCSSNIAPYVSIGRQFPNVGQSESAMIVNLPQTVYKKKRQRVNDYLDYLEQFLKNLSAELNKNTHFRAESAYFTVCIND